MCGLFGVLRSTGAADRERVSDAFVVLGTLAEERGYDSSGVALFTGRPVCADRAAGPPAPQELEDVSLDGCRVVKGRGRFSGVWRPDLLALLDHAPVAVGHTRWATQGSPYLTANFSPLVVSRPFDDPYGPYGSRGPHGPRGGIVATHNGDIDAAALRARLAAPPTSPAPPAPPTVGSTDSEPIFQALASCDDTEDIVEVLTTIVGRAALAWVDRARPDQVHLARAALSPLTVGVDTQGNLFWASNPRWFREVERHTAVRFAGAVMLREGTYLQITRGPRPRVTARAGFLPTARPGDLDDRIWTGFTPADRDRDRAQLRHRVSRTAVSGGTGEFATVR